MLTFPSNLHIWTCSCTNTENNTHYSELHWFLFCDNTRTRSALEPILRLFIFSALPSSSTAGFWNLVLIGRFSFPFKTFLFFICEALTILKWWINWEKKTIIMEYMFARELNGKERIVAQEASAWFIAWISDSTWQGCSENVPWSWITLGSVFIYLRTLTFYSYLFADLFVRMLDHWKWNSEYFPLPLEATSAFISLFFWGSKCVVLFCDKIRFSRE